MWKLLGTKRWYSSISKEQVELRGAILPLCLQAVDTTWKGEEFSTDLSEFVFYGNWQSLQAEGLILIEIT